MSNIWITLKRELMGHLFSPVAYVIAVLFHLFRGIEITGAANSFWLLGAEVDVFSTAYMLGQSSLFMIVLVPPILTMRCFAEEKRTGSLEVLMTAPVRDAEVVLGKWLASLVFFSLLWLPTLPLLWLLSTGPFLGADLAFGPVLSGYLGMLLLGALLLAVGCFTSSLTDNQLLASLSSMLFGYGLLAASNTVRAQLAGTEPAPWVRTLVDQLNVGDHLFHWFARGFVDSGHVAFYVAGTALFLYLTVRSVGGRR